MSDRPMTPPVTFDDGRLETALRDLAGSIDWPTAAPASGPDIALRVRVGLPIDPRSEAGSAGRLARGGGPSSWPSPPCWPWPPSRGRWVSACPVCA